MTRSRTIELDRNTRLRSFLMTMMTSLVLLALLTPLVVAEPVGDAALETERWDFDVYLNDKKVGKHFFEVVDREGMRRVQSEAAFDYKVLFITAYRYRHEASEQWAGDCLLDFEASTNANGDRIEVSGRKTASGFVVERESEPAELPQCVMSFAYWNPDFLRQSQLLNPQTGEYVAVSVEQVGTETLDVRGEAVPARRYRLTAENVDMTLWYSQDDEWLALESIAEGGHVIRYELS